MLQLFLEGFIDYFEPRKYFLKHGGKEDVLEYRNSYCFKDVDRDVVGQFNEAKKTEEVVVAGAVLVELAGDELAERVLIPGDEPVFVVDEQAVAEVVDLGQ